MKLRDNVTAKAAVFRVVRDRFPFGGMSNLEDFANDLLDAIGRALATPSPETGAPTLDPYEKAERNGPWPPAAEPGAPPPTKQDAFSRLVKSAGPLPTSAMATAHAGAAAEPGKPATCEHGPKLHTPDGCIAHVEAPSLPGGWDYCPCDNKTGHKARP